MIMCIAFFILLKLGIYENVIYVDNFLQHFFVIVIFSVLYNLKALIRYSTALSYCEKSFLEPTVLRNN
jgi:hypothetical protein